ncbi:methyltransferase [Clostridia bacterium]|nr:methyltransferase [Clostridia bacterium]
MKLLENGVTLEDNERLDDLRRNGYRLIQNPDLFSFGTDSVVLSSFCKIKRGETALDLCTGNGVIPILLCAKTEARHVTGIELQHESVVLAQKNVLLNGLADKITIHEGDIKDAKKLYGASFDVVCANPPYISAGDKNMNTKKAIARHEYFCTLNDVVKSAADCLRFGGRFYMVHRPQRLSDILCSFREFKLEAKTLRFVHSRIDKPPALILVEGLRGGLPGLEALQPLILYGENGEPTKELREIYGE